MTIAGTVTKTIMLLALVIAAAAVTWMMFVNGNANVMPLMIGGAIVGLILAIATCFKPDWSPFTAPVYAVAEGLFLGAISAMYNNIPQLGYDGIVAQAVCLTFGTMATMLVLYQTGVIRATERFKIGITAAVGGIALVYLVSIVMRLFGGGMPFIHDAGPIGIGFSVFVVVIAALSLILDFDQIERGAAYGAPKYMEWYGGFALLVTLIWLYIEILRLLSKLNRRR
jgi:uncharacterized YccA/Bax inhibitor family protein